MSKRDKAISLLVDQGLTLTEGELANRLGTSGSGARSVVSQVRRKGYAVYLNQGTLDSKGRRRASRYRVGTATKAMIASFFENGGTFANVGR